MAAPVNTYTTYSMRGIKEDVDDNIYNIDPTKTPFGSSLESFKVTQRTHEWQEDTNDAPNKDNAMVEGDDFSGQAVTPTLMLRNALQTFRKDIVTSEIGDIVDKYGRKSEHNYQLAKKTIELRTDIEAAMLSNNVAVAGNNTTASKMAGLELYTNISPSHGAGGSTAAIANSALPTTAPTDGTLRALTKDIFSAGLRTMWENGGMPKVTYLSMNQKEVVNKFDGLSQPTSEVAHKGFAAIHGVADIYVWESGPIAFVPVMSTRIRNRTLFISDGESIKRGYLRGIKREKMGKTGDNNKTMLVTDVTLKVTNRRGVMKIADLS